MQVRKMVAAGSVALALALAIGFGGVFTLAPISLPPDPNTNTTFKILNLTAPSTAQVGKEIQVCARVINSGKADGTQVIAFRVNDKNVATLSQTLESQQQADVCFKHTFTAAGAFDVTIATDNDVASAKVQVAQ